MGMAARTAVVAGTATAVSGRVARRQQEKTYEAMQAQQAQAAPAQAAPAPPTAEPAPAPAPAASEPAAGGDDVVAKLKELAELKSSGVLSDEEFEAAKAKLLA
jgi:hypothetical protein